MQYFAAIILSQRFSHNNVKILIIPFDLQQIKGKYSERKKIQKPGGRIKSGGSPVKIRETAAIVCSAVII
jgi:hypothetical protein